jgi:hypothetical protein
MSLLANGNVGIGTTDPQARLTVCGDRSTVKIETAEIMRFRRDVVPGVKNSNSASLRLGSFEEGISGRTRLDFNLSGAPGSGNNWGSNPDVNVMSLLANGNVGIGTTDIKRQLHVEGSEIHSGGSAAGFSFANRSTGSFVDSPSQGERWVWYSSGKPGVASLWSGRNLLSIDKEGNVGIGTSNPSAAKLEVNLVNSVGWTGLLNALRVTSPDPMYSMDLHTHVVGDSNVGYSFRTTFGNRTPKDALTIDTNGYVGIGKTTPKYALDVTGTINASVDVVVGGGDCAEEFDIVDAESIEPGTVMVIDNNGALRASEKAYDRRVAGVISGAGNLRPGITLDKQANKVNRLPLALTGKVYCKVDADCGAVEVGDLLTTSSTYGYAMKVNDHVRSIGAIIGKALRPLEAGCGLIPILVALQ